MSNKYITKLDKVKSFYKDYCPHYYESKKIIFALLLCEEDLIDDFIAFVDYCKDEGQEYLLPSTLEHDMRGIISKD